MRARHLLAIVALSCGPAAQSRQPRLDELPAAAVRHLAASLDAASAHPRHIWRDTPPTDDDGRVNAYIEIPRGDRRKWEFDMRGNGRAIDRIVSPLVGGFPVNYGFVPQTVSYDGDPFDALVLGPPLSGGAVVSGTIVGLMFMEDEMGFDSKVVLSPAGGAGSADAELTRPERDRIAEFFRVYKVGEPGKFSKVPGWGSIADARALVRTTHAFFTECRSPARGPCRVGR